MIQWEAMIDGTWFGLITGYLLNERSPIDTILHVREREMLTEVAQCLEKATGPGGFVPRELPDPLLAKVREGSIKISTRVPLMKIHHTTLIDPTQVKRDAGCEVIYLPPYYLVHTPGLFEGQVMKDSPKARNRWSQDQEQTAATTTKRQTKGHDRGHSH